MKYTILGASGFIGSNLYTYIKNKGYECSCPSIESKLEQYENLGHIIYCIGVTSDFRTRPFDTIEAHVCLLKNILQKCNYESFLYLSSTRIYNGVSESKETSNLVVNPNNFSDFYNISKIMGESICLAIPNKKIRIARLSNVIGEDFNSGNFIFSLINQAINHNKITLQQSSEIERDYIKLNSVISLLIEISKKGKERIYNIASGINISNQEILNLISSTTNCKIEILNKGDNLTFPKINNERICNEFFYQPENALIEIENLLKNYKK